MKDIKTNNELFDTERVFKLDKFLVTHTEWQDYGLRELKAIAVIYSGINPEWKKLNDVVYSAAEFNEKLGLNTKLGYKEMTKIFKNIKGVVHEGVYKPSSNNKEELMPLNVRFYSLIGSVEAVVNQTEGNDYIPSVQKASISFDKHIIDNILFAQNIVRNENGDIISGHVNQYFACREKDILAFNDAKALRLFLSLFRYNNVSVNMSFEDLCKKVGIKTQAPNKATLLRSAKSNGPKIDKTRKKFYDFKSRTLNKMIDEINRCTSMGLTYSEKIITKKDGTSEITIKFNIPDYREDLLQLETKNKTVIEDKNLNLKTGEDDHDDIGKDKDKINDEKAIANLNEEKESDSNDNSMVWFEDGFDWLSGLNDVNEEEKTDNLLQKQQDDINGLYSIYKLRMNISMREVEDIYIKNDRDAIKTNKVLQGML